MEVKMALMVTQITRGYKLELIMEGHAIREGYCGKLSQVPQCTKELVAQVSELKVTPKRAD